MKVRVLYHDHCFDGAASAAFFTRFAEEKFYRGAEFVYTGMAHKADQLFEDSLFDGDENAIVDFKYSPNPRLSWWFDHHQSAFLTPEDAAHFRRVKGGKRFYFDPHSRSCTIFIAKIAKEVYGYEAPDLADLVHWADVIDGAAYGSAAEAVSLRSAATQLTLLIEAVKGSEMVQRVIREMQTKPLDEIMREPEIRAAYEPLYERHLRSIDVISKEGHSGGGVIYFDVSAYDMDGYNKFIPYSLFPEVTYSVSVSLQSFRTKVSVGSNPWAPKEPTHNLASICERYGGGGHPRVGAISFPLGEVALARKAAAEIVAELKS